MNDDDNDDDDNDNATRTVWATELNRVRRGWGEGQSLFQRKM